MTPYYSISIRRIDGIYYVVGFYNHYGKITEYNFQETDFDEVMRKLQN
jgi:hypothetical protein